MGPSLSFEHVLSGSKIDKSFIRRIKRWIQKNTSFSSEFIEFSDIVEQEEAGSRVNKLLILRSMFQHSAL